MNPFEALLYGLIQGITEFLPVSSSGHLSLLGRILQTDESAMLSLATWLHAGTLIAVLVVMWREVSAILRDLTGVRMRQLILATLPAVLAAVLLGDWIEQLFAGRALGYAFLVTAVILAATLLRPAKSAASQTISDPAAAGQEPAATDRPIGYREALWAGLGQAIAIAPGVSRSGASLAALLLAGIRREQAIRFAFLMSIPAIFGGFVLDLFDLVRGENAALAAFGVGNIIIGVVAAGVSGYLVMQFMLRRLNRRGLLICAAYVAALGLLVLIDQHITRIFFV
jgi:undecaprenyl-diphosphatase